MSRKHISMRKIREILRLRFDRNCSHAEIAKSIGIGSTTVGECLSRAKKANISWPLPENYTDEQLELYLYPSSQLSQQAQEETQRGTIDWTYIHQELKRKHMTLMLLWTEYKQQSPQGLSYSQFCHEYRECRGHLDVWMRTQFSITMTKLAIAQSLRALLL